MSDCVCNKRSPCLLHSYCFDRGYRGPFWRALIAWRYRRTAGET